MDDESNNFAYDELLILKRGLKLVLIHDTKKDFEFLEKVSKLGIKIENLIEQE